MYSRIFKNIFNTGIVLSKSSWDPDAICWSISFPRCLKKSNKVFEINFSHLKVFDRHSAVEIQLIIDNLFFKDCLFSVLEQVE